MRKLNDRLKTGNISDVDDANDLNCNYRISHCGVEGLIQLMTMHAHAHTVTRTHTHRL